MFKNEINTDELPSSYLRTASQILEESGGGHKLKMRNDSIRGDLIELGIRLRSQVKSECVDGRIFYYVENTGIVVNLQDTVIKGRPANKRESK